jgi:hypothetical protein
VRKPLTNPLCFIWHLCPPTQDPVQSEPLLGHGKYAAIVLEPVMDHRLARMRA